MSDDLFQTGLDLRQLRLDLRHIELEEEQIRVTVADTGIGIPPSEHEEMFKEFYQVEGLVAQGQGGHGLGLAICKRFMRRIGLQARG